MGCIKSTNRPKRPVMVHERMAHEQRESVFDPRLSILGGGIHPNNLNQVFTHLSINPENSEHIQWDGHAEILSVLKSHLPEETLVYPFTKYSFITQGMPENELEPVNEDEVKKTYEQKSYAMIDTNKWDSLIATTFLNTSEVGYYLETPGTNKETEIRLFYVTSNKENSFIKLFSPVMVNNKIHLESLDITQAINSQQESTQLQELIKPYLEALAPKNVFIKEKGRKSRSWYFAFRSKQSLWYWGVKQGCVILTNSREEATECKAENLTQSINFD